MHTTKIEENGQVVCEMKTTFIVPEGVLINTPEGRFFVVGKTVNSVSFRNKFTLNRRHGGYDKEIVYVTNSTARVMRTY